MGSIAEGIRTKSLNILYVSAHRSQKLFDKQFIFDKTMVSNVQVYEHLLTVGLSKNADHISVLSTANIPSSIIPDGYFEEEDGVSYNYLARTKAPILRHIQILFNGISNITKWNRNRKDSVVMVNGLCFTALLSVLCTTKIFKIPSILLLTDLPEFDYKSKLFVSFYNKLFSKFSAYVITTRQMNIINPNDHPYVVIEGLVNSDMVHKTNDIKRKASPRTCVFCGTCDVKYGVIKLVDAFIKAQVLDFELHIYGDGDARDVLRQLKSHNVVYHGLVSNEEAINAQIRATVLVNPRSAEGEYTKYSYPSKNMEYMASGTPLIATKLDGMPEDHYPHIYFFEESVDGMTRCLKDILSKSTEELYFKGTNAKEFIITEKNNIKQAFKIVEMMKRL